MNKNFAVLCEEDDWPSVDLPPHSFKDFEWNNRSAWVSRCTWRHPVSTAKDFSAPFSSVLENAANHYDHISIDREVLGGTPRISGMRIPVYMLLDAIEHYGNLEGVLTSYPTLTEEQVSQAVCFAAEVLEQPVDHET
jgi:uncharacterized protein (DUF433 family)